LSLSLNRHVQKQKHVTSNPQGRPCDLPRVAREGNGLTTSSVSDRLLHPRDAIRSSLPSPILEPSKTVVPEDKHVLTRFGSVTMLTAEATEQLRQTNEQNGSQWTCRNSFTHLPFTSCLHDGRSYQNGDHA
jgi:hypothetical protein